MYCFRCMSSPCRCNRRQRIQPLAAPITEYPAKIASPKDVSDLLFWFRADLGVILSGLVIKRWEDQSGNGYHLTALGEPTLIPGDGEYNQKPAVRFDGQFHADGNYTYFTNEDFPEQAQPYTLFIVCDGQNTEWEGVFISAADEVIGGFQFYSDITPSPIGDPSGQHAAVAFGGDYLGAYGPECDMRSPHVYCIVANGESSEIYVDGFKTTIASGEIGNGALAGLAIGNGQFVPSGFVYPLIGRIAEVAGYSGVMSEANRGAVMRYLRERYATPVTSEGAQFEISGLQPVVISGLNYDQGDVDGGGESIVITGSGDMTTVTSVDFGGAPATITDQDATTVTVTLPAHAAGSVNVTCTNGAGASNALTFEYWYPGTEPECTLVFDSVSVPYAPNNPDTWTARFASNSSSGQSTLVLGAPDVANDGPPALNGGPNFSGLLAQSPLLNDAAHPSANVAGFCGPTVASGAGNVVAGTLAVVATADPSRAGEDYSSTVPYASPSIAGGPEQGTLGVGYARDSVSLNPSFGGHIYDVSEGYIALTVECDGSALHAVLLRWGASVPGTETVDLSLDGATSGTKATGYDSQGSIHGNARIYLDATKFGVGGHYAGTSRAYQKYAGNVRACVMWNIKISDSVITKFYKWSQQRYGVA